MLTLHRIEIENFACFGKLVVEPSRDKDKPLTVIRAENGSGKTTFLRAVRWGMYGEKGLPAVSSQLNFSLHPAWWRPEDGEVKTEVAIEFETDGSSRHFTESNGSSSAVTHDTSHDVWPHGSSSHNTPSHNAVSHDASSHNGSRSAGNGSRKKMHRIERSVITIGSSSRKSDMSGAAGNFGAAGKSDDFYRDHESVTLMFRDLDGRWLKHEHMPDEVIEQLLPWGLRDFFVMDADEATDFVGGSENKSISRKDYRAKTSNAIRHLLGLNVFQLAQERVESAAQNFAKQATKAIGDRSLDHLQEELDRARLRKQDTENEINELQDQEEDLDDKLVQLESDLQQEMKLLGAYDVLIEQRERNKKEYKRAVDKRLECCANLANALEQTNLLASLASSTVSEVQNLLSPMRSDGHIPGAYLPFVRNLLEEEVCVCGTDLSQNIEAQQTIIKRVEDTDSETSHASYLHHIYEAARSLNDKADPATWHSYRQKHAAELAEWDQRVDELQTEKRDFDSKIKRIDEVKVQVLRKEKAAHKDQLDNTKRKLATLKVKLDPLIKEINSKSKEIAQRQRNELAASDHRASEHIAQLCVTILENAYSSIENEQISSLSRNMNKMFHMMAANVSEADFDDEQESDKANLRMIAKVGVRPAEDARGSMHRAGANGGGNRRQSGRDGGGDFEIYALNSRGRYMPPVEINGASRRVLAMSFVLALCEESQTRAPLIADSLLNFMSGSVRYNTLRVTSEHSRQPILLLTYADIESPETRELVDRYAGVTYTLTGQWDSSVVHRHDTVQNPNLVNPTGEYRVSLLCTCSPHEHCNICERDWQPSHADSLAPSSDVGSLARRFASSIFKLER